MRDFKKFFAFVSLSFLLFVSGLFEFAQPAKAAESDSFKQEVGGIFATIPYSKDEVTVQKIDSTEQNVDQVNIYDKDTNELITEIKVVEEPQLNTGRSTLSVAPLAGNTSYLTVSRSTGSSYGKAYLKARLNIYSSGSFRQINSVDNTWWEQDSGMTYFEQQNSNALSTSGKWKVANNRN